MIQIELPFPPSVNRYWRSVKGRVLISKEGREYREKVVWRVRQNMQQHKRSYGDDRLSVLIVAYPPDARRRDLDNLPKAVLDALQHAGLYKDDSQIDDLHITRGVIIKPGKLVVTISSIEADQRAA